MRMVWGHLLQKMYSCETETHNNFLSCKLLVRAAGLVIVIYKGVKWCYY